MLIFKCDPMKQFTCWNGDCLSLEKRCDERSDCNDRSDEFNCQQIRFEKDVYRKTHVPKNPRDERPLEVEVSFDVIDIVEINEAKVSHKIYKLGHFFC